MSKLSRASRSGGFTLVELLVVIGIIALLIGILLPTLSQARNAAKTLKCLSNTRQIGQATVFYTNDWDGMLPPNEVNGSGYGDPFWGSRFWFQKLNEYASATVGADGQGSSDTTYLCPDGNPGLRYREWTGDSYQGTPVWYLGDDPLWGTGSWGGPSPGQQNLMGALLYGISVNDGNYESTGTHYAVSAWYGGTDPFYWIDGSAQKPGQLGNAFPISTFGVNGAVPERKLTKIASLKNATQTALFFDGTVALFMDPRRINARHGDLDKSNFVYADGHAATATRGTDFPADDGPEVAGNPGGYFWGGPGSRLTGEAWPIRFVGPPIPKATWESGPVLR